jgi:hypothetical protein
VNIPIKGDKARDKAEICGEVREMEIRNLDNNRIDRHKEKNSAVDIRPETKKMSLEIKSKLE